MHLRGAVHDTQPNNAALSNAHGDIKAITRQLARYRKDCLTQAQKSSLGRTTKTTLVAYKERIKAVRAETIRRLEHELQESIRGTWRSAQLDVAISLLRHAGTPQILTLSQYWRCTGNRYAPPDLPSAGPLQPGSVVVVSEKEADWLFRHILDTNLDMPILIHPNADWQPDLSFADLDKKLRHVDRIDVQDSARRTTQALAEQWTGIQASESLATNQGPPRNLLSIQRLVTMDRVWFGLMTCLEWPDTMIQAAPAEETSGTRSDWHITLGKVPRQGDMSICSEWTIFGQDLSISLPHWDAGGVYTAMTSEEHRKLWLMADPMTLNEKHTYGRLPANWEAGSEQFHPSHPDPNAMSRPHLRPCQPASCKAGVRPCPVLR